MIPRTALTPPASPRAGLQSESEPGDCSELPPLQPPPASGTPTSPALCWVRMWTHSKRKKGASLQQVSGPKRVSEARLCGVASASLCHSSLALLLFYFHSWMHSLKELTAQHRRPDTQSAFSLSLSHTHTVTAWHHWGSFKGRRTHTTHMAQCETLGLALKRTAFPLPSSPPLSSPPPLLKPSC